MTDQMYHPDETEQDVLNVLKQEARANPYLIREQTGIRKQYVNDALRQLAKADLVRKVTVGLYEYTGGDSDATKSDANGAVSRADYEACLERVEELEAKLSETEPVDVDLDPLRDVSVMVSRADTLLDAGDVEGATDKLADANAVLEQLTEDLDG